MGDRLEPVGDRFGGLDAAHVNGQCCKADKSAHIVLEQHDFHPRGSAARTAPVLTYIETGEDEPWAKSFRNASEHTEMIIADDMSATGSIERNNGRIGPERVAYRTVNELPEIRSV